MKDWLVNKVDNLAAVKNQMNGNAAPCPLNVRLGNTLLIHKLQMCDFFLVTEVSTWLQLTDLIHNTHLLENILHKFKFVSGMGKKQQQQHFPQVHGGRWCPTP